MRFVALLRGMNLAGNRLSVADLRSAATEIGWQDVRTYLASGNLVATATGTRAALARQLRASTAQRGLDVPVLVVPRDELTRALRGCPFHPRRGKDVHAFFCWDAPVLDAAAVSRLRGPGEALQVRGRIVWLHTPDGLGRSVLGAKLPTVVTGTEMTARNLNTVRALAELLDEPRRAPTGR
ncbi:MAG: DUF1697 domain-containing protein [Dermatophilaceae bacterium]